MSLKHLSLVYFIAFYSEAQTVGGIVNKYASATSYNLQQNQVSIDFNPGISDGDDLLIIQMKGAKTDSTNTDSFGNIIDYNGAGNFQFNKVLTVNNLIISSGYLCSSIQSSKH